MEPARIRPCPVVRLLLAVLLLSGCGAAAAQAPTTVSAPPSLAGTAWRLVKFQGGDETILRPDDRAKYTLEFGADGTVSARIDCNRGHGTWTSPAPSQLTLGPLALTRAQCPPGSLHDRLIRDWSFVRSYVIQDGHLFLSLFADAGIYEFEPAA
jgi:para-nitrobenzyl esterase